MQTLQHFIAELQRRKVLRVATGYLVVAWIVLQVAVALQTAWALSAAFSGTILNLMILAFPAAVGLTWFFEWTPQGIKRTTGSGDGAIAKLQTTDFVLGGALALVFAIGVAQLFWPSATTPAAETATSGHSKTAEADKPKAEPPRLGDKSIAVLPFKNLSPDKDDAYFADGLTEETLNVLTLVPSLKVISRTSSEAFKGKDTPLPEIAKTLGVRYILEGSVRRDGDKVRVTAQLIDVPTDTHVWSKTFEPKLEQVFLVQNAIARALAASLDLEMSVSEGPRDAPTKNMAAYRIWLQVRELNRTGGTTFSAIIDLFKRAIALDPNFAEAHGHLAIQLANQAWRDPTVRKTALADAKREAATAEKLNPNFLGVHLVRGSMAFYELRWDDAEQEYLKLFDDDRGQPLGCVAMAFIRWRAGYFKDAHRYLAEGQSLDPLSRTFDFGKLLLAFDEGDDEEVNTIARLMTWAPKDLGAYAYYMLAKIAQDKGDHQAAAIQFRAFMTARGKNRSIMQPVLNALKSPASVAPAIKVLRAEEAKDPSFDIEPFLYLIDPANAWIDELNARIADHNTIPVAWTIGGIWRVIAQGEGDNPKVKALLRNAGLVDYWKKHGWPDRCRQKGEDDFECS